MPKWTKEKFVIYLLYLGPKHKGWYNHSTHDFNINCIWQNSRKATIRWKRAAGRYTFRIHQLRRGEGFEKQQFNSGKECTFLTSQGHKVRSPPEKETTRGEIWFNKLFPSNKQIPFRQNRRRMKKKKKKTRKKKKTLAQLPWVPMSPWAVNDGLQWSSAAVAPQGHREERSVFC